MRNRNKPMFRLNRVAADASTLMNQFCTVRVENLEFWYVTGSNDFNAPLSGAGIGYEDYPNGATFYIDVDVVDSYFSDNVFQHSPCCIRICNVPKSRAPYLQGDGKPGQNGVYAVFENCEFDTSAAHIIAENSHVDLEFRSCRFYGGRHVYKGCTGRVIYDAGCRFFGNSFINANDFGNSFDQFEVHGQFDLCTTQPSISIAHAKIVDIDAVMAGASGQTGIELNDCDGGRVHAMIQGSGCDALAGSGLTNYVAAVKGLGCRNILFTGMAITDGIATPGRYNGFGILLGDSATRSSQNNYVTGNLVRARYDGASYNGQSRYINVTELDLLGPNYDARSGAVGQRIGAFAQKRISLTYSASIAVDAQAANSFDVIVNNRIAFSIQNPTGGMDGQVIKITVKNASGAALGMVAWGNAYKMSAWTSPGDGSSQSISFEYNGINWIEVARSAADVPN